MSENQVGPQATLRAESELSIKVFRPVGPWRFERWYDRLWYKLGQDKRPRAGRVIAAGFVVEDYGVVSRLVVTNAGVAFLVDAFQNLVEIELMNFHAFGTGTVAENVTDTVLGTEVETRATGVQSEPASNQYRTVGTVSFTATRTIGEHGIFSASSAGTLWDRSLVSPTIGVNNGDSIQATYTLTINAGG